MPLECLQDLLRVAADAEPSRGLVMYSLGNTSTPKEISYSSLYAQAHRNSRILRRLEDFRTGSPVLIHLDDHWNMLVWYWAVLYANGIPVPSSPFSNIPEHRREHIQGLSTLLAAPICITRTKLLSLFDGHHSLKLHTIESLQSTNNNLSHLGLEPTGSYHDVPAMLMLTSGSTGNAKAVRLTHRQVLAAVAGKASLRKLPVDKPFLNWIGLDHVASLVEIHLQAIYLGVDQVHVHAPDLISSPSTFLDLLSHHQASRSFAPNFFLAKLIATINSRPHSSSDEAWDLRNLTVLASGGEANDLETCTAASSLLGKHGATSNVITPGFGMTETCAGAIYNLNCPAYDIQNERAFASLGKCMPGIEMRVTTPTNDRRTLLATPNEPGDLEVRGEVVFEGYYHNEQATTEAFTSDGWFRTGDQAIIDSEGNLNLIGRVKDTMNINGVKFTPQDVELALEHTLGARVTRVVCFPSRSTKSHTEQVTVAYVPGSWPMESKNLVDINDLSVKASIMCTGARPCVFALDDESLLPKSTLGKISRAKMRTMFEEGVFAKQLELHNLILENHRLQNRSLPANDTEIYLLEDFTKTLDIQPDLIGVDTPIFEMGVTSMDLIRLKRHIDNRLGLDIPIITLMTNSTARSMARALKDLSGPGTYNPVVTLRHEGSQTPLWLVHPGVGEVLVFLGLSKHIHNRPVYALRARGFDGEPCFKNIEEAVDTYYTAIKRKQPYGPYAIAGYSYGTMLAFEISKLLERNDVNEVRFLGSFNLPPHIKSRMRQLNWNMCLLHLCYFLGLITEQHADSISDCFKHKPREDALTLILSMADKHRMLDLSLDSHQLTNWAQLTYKLQSMAVDYEPSGSVVGIDVFYATPLSVAANSKEDWLEHHLSRWADFCRTKPRFHEVGGAHYTMIGPENVWNFSKRLGMALKARGL